MKHELSQTFYFESAHTLQRQVDATPSRRVHGHTYIAEVTLRGEADPATGMVMDLGLLRRAIETVRLDLDHHFLNDVEALGPATLENLCSYLWKRFSPQFGSLWQVSVRRDQSGDRCTLRAD
jgi:6-pyruvoyltetrahydropterin/6-carboxytetrahydropterin synthase